MRIERIEWQDSGYNINDGWQSVSDMLKGWKSDNMTVYSAGVVAYEDDDMVGLSSSFSRDNDTYFGVQLIAKPNILIREVLWTDESFQQLSDRSGSDGVHRNKSSSDRRIGLRNV